MRVLATLNINNVLCPNSRNSFIAAAQRWNCEYYEVITNQRPDCYPSYNKFNILSDAVFDRVFFVDSDTVICSNAPNPFCISDAPFCAVKDIHMESIGTPTFEKELHDFILPSYNRIKTDIGDSLGDSYLYNFFNSGVMLFTPSIVSPVIKRNLHLLPQNELKTIGHYEQAILNYIIQKEMPITYFPRKWNTIRPDVTKPMTGFIYHFTGIPGFELKAAMLHYAWNV